jgi:hypothetical protein
VGADGTILECEGGVWSLYPSSPTSEDLYGVYVDHTGIAWACGAHGTILRYDGSSWNVVPDVPTSNDLHSIWGGDELVCVGAQGTILHSSDDGLSWVLDDCPVTVDLNGVAFTGQYGWIVGDEGTILSSWFHSSIQPESVGRLKALYSSEGNSGGDSLKSYNK